MDSVAAKNPPQPVTLIAVRTAKWQHNDCVDFTLIITYGYTYEYWRSYK